MTTATLVLIILLWPLCLFIIGLILLQGGAGDISSAFGGGGQLDSTLGVGAGRKMSKLTAWLAGIFLLIVLALSVPHKGDFSKIAGTATPTPAKNEPKPPGAPLVIPPVAIPAPVSVPAPTPAVPAPAVVPAPAPAVPVAPAPAQPEAAVPAVQPAPVVVQPAVAPAPAAQPAQSGVKLDEPAKQ